MRLRARDLLFVPDNSRRLLSHVIKASAHKAKNIAFAVLPISRTIPDRASFLDAVSEMIVSVVHMHAQN